LFRSPESFRSPEKCFGFYRNCLNLTFQSAFESVPVNAIFFKEPYFARQLDDSGFVDVDFYTAEHCFFKGPAMRFRTDHDAFVRASWCRILCTPDHEVCLSGKCFVFRFSADIDDQIEGKTRLLILTLDRDIVDDHRVPRYSGILIFAAEAEGPRAKVWCLTADDHVFEADAVKAGFGTFRGQVDAQLTIQVRGRIEPAFLLGYHHAGAFAEFHVGQPQVKPEIVFHTDREEVTTVCAAFCDIAELRVLPVATLDHRDRQFSFEH